MDPVGEAAQGQNGHEALAGVLNRIRAQSQNSPKSLNPLTPRCITSTPNAKPSSQP